MLAVLTCITAEHHPGLVLLAAAVCIAGSAIALRLYGGALKTDGGQRAGWLVLAATAAGFSIWCTHFIAMLGYQTQASISFEPLLTATSLIVAVVGAWAGLALACVRQYRFQPMIGGAVLGLGVSSMHYLGMLAYRVHGVVHWHSGYIVASILLAVVLGGAAIQVASRDRKSFRSPLALGLMVASIVGLHFTGMTAVQITPLTESIDANQAEAFQAMALAVAAVGMTIIGVGFVSYLIEGRTRTEAYRRLRHIATHDTLTGLPNRARLIEHLEETIVANRLKGEAFAVIVVDLQRFKEVNDSHGHATGDEVLRVLGGRLIEAPLTDVFCARTGGDEFTVIAGLGDGRLADQVIEPLNDLCTAPILVGDLELRVGARFGVATFPRDGESREILQRNAEGAMVRARTLVGQQVCYYDASIHDELRRRRALAADLRLAIERHELELHYQVQACVLTGTISGFEALLRWRHPVRGFVPPIEFISLAEEEGLIVDLGQWVLREACREACNWPPEHKVAVNLSPIEIVRPDLPGVVATILAETGLPAHRLEIELTESAIIHDSRRCLEVIRAIKALGVGVALDDFGTGYSSLSVLRAFPFDRIKLDRSFITEIDSSLEALGIVKAVLALGDCLGVAVLAEGIETETQLEALGREGLKEAQGYLLGRPVPAAGRPAGDRLQVVARVNERTRGGAEGGKAGAGMPAAATQAHAAAAAPVNAA